MDFAKIRFFLEGRNLPLSLFPVMSQDIKERLPGCTTRHRGFPQKN